MKHLKATSCGLFCLCVVQIIFGLLGNDLKGQQLNQPAPAINFSTCLNALHLDADFYKGKTVVLDFWATWCGPCIASHPHLDSLSRHFSSDSVVFAIISCEAKNKVARFLKGRNIKAYYLVDSVTMASTAKANGGFAGITYQSFDVIEIPRTIIIDKKGRLVWTGNTAGLSSLILNQIISGRLQNIARKKANLKNGQKWRDSIFAATKKDTLNENEVTLITASLPYTNFSMSKRVGVHNLSNFVDGGSRAFGDYYEDFTGLTKTRFVDKTGLGPIYMRVDGKPGMSKEDFNATALDLLCKAYNIKFIKTERLVDAYELKIIDSAKFSREAATMSGSKDHGGSAGDEISFTYTNCSLEFISNGLEDYLNTPVFFTDKTYSLKRCDMNIKKGNYEQLRDFLAETYGLQLQKVKRTIEFTEIVKS